MSPPDLHRKSMGPIPDIRLSFSCLIEIDLPQAGEGDGDSGWDGESYIIKEYRNNIY